MNLGKIDFRTFDRTWIVFDKKSDIKKICKKLKIKEKDGIFLGYVYISHEEGMQIKVAGHVYLDEDEYSLEQDMIYKKSTIDFNKKLKYHIKPISDEIIKNIRYTDQIKYHYESLYNRNSIVESRKIKEIDEFRNESFIDDIELTFKYKEKEEFIWARIEDCSKEKLIFVCSLLEKSKLNKNYKEKTLVLAKVIQEKNEIDLVIDGIVDKVEK